MTRFGRAGLSALAGFAVLLAGCGDKQPPSETAPSGGAAAGEAGGLVQDTAAGPFNPTLSQGFLEDAVVSAAAGDLARAAENYQAAALTWPDSEAAWRGLVDTARQQGDEPAAEAANFVLRRIYLFPSGALGVQREYRAALLGYVDEHRDDPEANSLKLAYALVLADYYAYRYTEQGTYVPPEGYFNLRWEDVPAAAVSAGILLVNAGTLISGALSD